MKTVRWLRPLAVMTALVALLIGVGAAVANAGSQRATASGGRHHHHHKRQERGPRGPRGLPGPPGAAGAPGAPGVGTPYVFAEKKNTPSTPVFNGNGVLIEAGCSTAGFLELTVRPQGGDHNIIEVTAFDNTEGGHPRGASYFDSAVNEPIDMLVGGSGIHDYNGLLGVRTLSGLMTTVQWWAMGSFNASQGDCVGGGTVSP
jgi:hypothetical protein